MKKIFFILLALSISNSCKKDDAHPFYNLQYQCTKALKFSCDGISSDQYFKATIKGQEFCVSDDDLYNNLTTYFTRGTSSYPFEIDPNKFSGVGLSFLFYAKKPEHSTVTCAGVPTNYLIPKIALSTPALESADSTLPAIKTLMDEFISLGEKEWENKENQNGWRLSITWNCGDTTYYAGFDRRTDCIQGWIHNGSTERKNKNDKLVITDLQITETPFYLIYDITIELTVDLYAEDRNGDSFYYGRLKDGVFKHRAIVDK